MLVNFLEEVNRSHFPGFDAFSSFVHTYVLLPSVSA